MQDNEGVKLSEIKANAICCSLIGFDWANIYIYIYIYHSSLVVSSPGIFVFNLYKKGYDTCQH